MRNQTYFYWSDLKIGDRFRIAGYDDLLQKISDTHAKGLGAGGMLRRPVLFAKRGQSVLMVTEGTDASGLILAL